MIARCISASNYLAAYCGSFALRKDIFLLDYVNHCCVIEFVHAMSIYISALLSGLNLIQQQQQRQHLFNGLLSRTTLEPLPEW